MNIFSIIRLICGLTFFLFGMQVMSGNLEKMAGGKLEQLLRKMTANPLISLLLGAATAIPIEWTNMAQQYLTDDVIMENSLVLSAQEKV